MATGNTISGSVRVVREDTEGNRSIVAGPFAQSEVDDFNNTFNPEDYIYLNTQRSNKKQAPLQAREVEAPATQFESGELIVVQHQASSTVTNDIDVSADSFNIQTLRMDKNRGRIYPDVLDQASQELSTDPAESTSDYVDFYQETVPDRTEIRMVGQFAAVAVEN